MKVFVKERVRAGSKCQEFRDDRQVQKQINVIDQPDGRFHTIHLHCIGPIVDSNGYQHALTVIDRFTGYLVIHPLKSLTFVDTFYAIQSAWIKYYRYPTAVITDKFTNFVNCFMEQLNDYLGIRHIRASSGHPRRMATWSVVIAT